jgi:flavin reductase (DIM6/NTAB) family NADH-FMN oxidoreductase RutF
MDIDASSLDGAATYRLLVGAVVPRPIAWVTSGIDPQPTNLAPFSAFTWVAKYPAMLGITVERRTTGRKDTARNILEHGEYVVNIADETLLEDLHASSEWFDPEVSEAELRGLELAPSAVIATKRLAAAPVSMECVLREVLQFGSEDSQFIVGEVVSFHVRDELYGDGKIDVDAMRPIGRLAGPRYTRLGEIVRLPSVPGG